MAAGDLTTLTEVRQLAQIPTLDTEQNNLISSLITSLSTAITRYCQRQFTDASTQTYQFEYAGTGWLDLAPYDVRTVTLVQVDTDLANQTTITPENYRLFPYPNPDGVFTAIRFWTFGGQFRFRHRRVGITGDWGFSSVPADVAKACALEVLLYLRRDAAAFSRVLNLDTAKVERPDMLSPVTRGLLSQYKRVTVAD